MSEQDIDILIDVLREGTFHYLHGKEYLTLSIINVLLFGIFVEYKIHEIWKRFKNKP